MYVAVRRYEVKPGSEDEIGRTVKEGFVPIVSKAPGFIAYYAISRDGFACSISVFQNQAQAEESNRLAAGWVKTVGHLFPKAPQVSAGEARCYAGPKT